MAADRTLGYNDVLDAWNHYLKHDNNGRGVVLIGHSQGSGVLSQLIRNEIDGKPIQSRIISALLLGTNVAVPKGKDVGGAFKQLPLCRTRRSDRLRRHLRVVPLDDSAAAGFAVRPRGAGRHGSRLHQSRGAGRRRAASCTRYFSDRASTSG